ncbi:MAG: trigger factor [Verrucomicrobiales bacterium]
MNITINKKPNCEAELHIEVDSAAVRTRRQAIVHRYQQLAKIPGFRPGKTPLPVVEKRFAREIDGELREALVGDGCREAASEHKLSVISVRDVRDDTFQPDGNFSFTADLTLEPDITLPEYKGIEVTAPRVEVTDEMVEARLEELRKNFATYNDVTGRAVATGDIAIVSYSGTVGGVPVAEVAENAHLSVKGSEDYWVRMEDGSFLPGFIGQIEGMEIGAQREGVKVNLDENYPIAELAGKEVEYAVTLKGIKEQVLPEADDTFAQRLLPGKTMTDLRDTLRSRLTDEVTERRRSLIVDQIMGFLNNSTETELPPELLQRETQRRVDDLVERGIRQGMENDDLEAQQEQIFAAAADQAKTNLKTTFILEQIARKEDISVNDQELINRIAWVAQRNNKPLKKFVNDLKRDNAIPGIRGQMLIGKAIDFLVLNAKVNEAAPETAGEA